MQKTFENKGAPLWGALLFIFGNRGDFQDKLGFSSLNFREFLKFLKNKYVQMGYNVV